MKAITELKSKQSIINRIYDIAGNHTQGIFNDDYWHQKNCIVRDLVSAGVEMDLQTCYYTTENKNKIWEYKANIGQFSFDIRIIANLPDGLSSYYDLTISVY